MIARARCEPRPENSSEAGPLRPWDKRGLGQLRRVYLLSRRLGETEVVAVSREDRLANERVGGSVNRFNRNCRMRSRQTSNFLFNRRRGSFRATRTSDFGTKPSEAVNTL